LAYGETSCGLAVRGSMALETSWNWRLKDWIDRNWMQMFNFPGMKMNSEISGRPNKLNDLENEFAKNIEASRMRCGGCGSKVGSDVLTSSMKTVLKNVRDRSAIIVGIRQKDDVAVLKPYSNEPFLQLMSVDFIKSFITDPFVFGKICAMHAMSDVFAKCGRVKTALAVPVIPFGPNKIMQDNLTQLMTGAVEALEEEGCILVGGHSTEGDELSLGLFVQGEMDESNFLSKGGLKEDQVLILTKPIGIGIVFAGEMRFASSPEAINHAVETALISNHKAALCLQKFGARSSTDITGFGLIGHLVEMIKATELRLQAELSLDEIPFIIGSIELSESGYHSSLYSSNYSASCAVDCSNIEDPRYKLLYDPQTSGGLLSSIPSDCVRECLDELHELGYKFASAIGKVNLRPEGQGMIRILG
jgi:selenide, water dikinase